MSLFDATVAQVVKDVGNESLIPVDDRSSADYCKILSVIERKTYSWYLPWKSSQKYIPTEINLNDLLVQQIDVKNLATSTVLLEDYESTPSFHRSGKLGGKIAEEFDIEVDVNETMQVSMNLGNVMKKEILWQKLYDDVNNKKMKVDHPLIQAIQNSKKRSLFLIGMVVTAGSELSEEKDTTVSGDLGGKPYVALHLNTSGSSDQKQHRKYNIPLGTCFGYLCYKIKIDKNGILNLKLAEDVVDAAAAADTNVQEKMSAEEQIKNELRGLLLDPVHGEIIQKLRKILKINPICAFMLNIFVEGAVDTLEGELDGKKITVKQLQKMLPESSTEDCIQLLEKLDFQIHDKEDVVYPQDERKLPLLKSLYLLLDAVSELNSSQVKALTECNTWHRSGIFYVIRKVIESDVVSHDDAELQGLFTGDNEGRAFLKSIGFDLTKTDDSPALVKFMPEKSSLLHVYSTLISVFGMCSV